MRLLYPYGEEFTGERAREVHTLHRAHSLAKTGAEVDLVSAQSSRFPTGDALLKHFNLEPEPRLRLHFLPRQFNLGPLHLTSTRFFYSALGRWISHQPRFDAAYLIHLKAADYLERAHPTLPVIFEAHEIFADSFPDHSPKFKKITILEKRVYEKCRAVVATSQFLFNELSQRTSFSGPSLISPNCVEPPFFTIPLENAEPHEVVYVGSFQHWKGVDVAVAAMKQLPEHHLTIVGGHPDQIKQLKAEAGTNVKFVGYQPRSELQSYLAKASIALIPNRLEPKSSLYSFPMKLVEYAAAGRLIVASEMPVLEELNLGPWIKRVAPENPEALAQAIQSFSPIPVGTTFLASNPLRESARAWATAFTWAAQAQRILDFLSHV